MFCKPVPLSVGLDACVHLWTRPLSPARDHSGVPTPHSPSSTPRVAGPGRRACSSILMPSNILAQSVCPRGKHLSSDSGPVAISMGRGARCGPRQPGCSPSRPPARLPPRPRSRGGAAPAGSGLRLGPRAAPGERGVATRWPRAPASCGRAGAAASPRRAVAGTRSHARRLLCHLLVSPGAGLRRRRQTEPRGGDGGGGGCGGGGGGGGGTAATESATVTEPWLELASGAGRQQPRKARGLRQGSRGLHNSKKERGERGPGRVGWGH